MRLKLLAWMAVSLSASILTAAEVKTFAGNGTTGYSGNGGPAIKAGIGGPFGVTIAPQSGLCVCETVNHSVRRIQLQTGFISTVAGTGKEGYSGDNARADFATCREPYEVCFDKHDNMYFVEMKNHIVRRVDAKTDLITTVAGTGKMGFSGDKGPATQAMLNVPHSITIDGDGNLYIADIGNHRVRVVDARTGIIDTLSGTGKRAPTPDNSEFEGTPLNGPRCLFFDGEHSLLLALREGNAVYRLDLTSRRIHHIAGTGKSGYAGDHGPAKDALLSGPKGIALGPNGDIYLADTESHTIRVIRKTTGTIETLVGDGKQGDGPDGDPKHCRLNRPHGVCVDKDGKVYIGDSSNNKVRVFIP